MKILYNAETILERCQGFLSDYAELLHRIGEEIPDELEQLEEELSEYIKSRDNHNEVYKNYQKLLNTK